MYDSTRAVLCLATAAAAAIAILPLTAAPVSAAQLTLKDARGDMWFIEEGSTEPDPAPTARVGDFVRATFRHTDRRVEVRSKFVELRRTGRQFEMFVTMRDQDHREAIAMVRTSRQDRDGRTRLFTGRGRDIACNIRHRVDYTRNTVRISFPRLCLDNPRWLRFQATSSQSGRSLRFAHVDDPSTAGEPSLALTGRVRSG
ncbi:MAG TPA: hypothetical protein VFV76_01330 [Actinomycetes bacterium]|nr:hypothetical protein [Actinomycetes bacterium]